LIGDIGFGSPPPTPLGEGENYLLLQISLPDIRSKAPIWGFPPLEGGRGRLLKHK